MDDLTFEPVDFSDWSQQKKEDTNSFLDSMQFWVDQDGSSSPNLNIELKKPAKTRNNMTIVLYGSKAEKLRDYLNEKYPLTPDGMVKLLTNYLDLSEEESRKLVQNHYNY